MAILRVYLFGGLRLFHGEAPLPPFPTQKTRSLFAYLATFREQPHPRSILAKILWPGTPPSQAGRNLNTTLWRLRRTIPPGHIAAEGDRLALACAADCWLDTAAFEASLLEAGLDPVRALNPTALLEPGLSALLQAVQLYRGDLLEGLDEPWCLVEAERLRSRYLEALQRLLMHHRAIGEPATALDYARRLLAVDPLREEGHRQAMELYVLLGRPNEAIAQFEYCRQLLQDELAITPLPETVTLYERICAGRSAPQPAKPLPEMPRHQPLPRSPFDDLGQAPLVGREDERAALQAQIEAAGHGQGGLLLIQGGAGIGKTRLLQEAERYAESRGWLVLHGACHELRQPPPYQGWREALRPTRQGIQREHLVHIDPDALAELGLLLPGLGRMFPNLPKPDPLPLSERQNRLLQAIATTLLALTQVRPCLVLLEDLHWADEAGLETLEHIVQQMDGCPLLCIGTTRPPADASPRRKTLLRLAQHPRFQQLDLSPLDWSETARLVGEMLGWNAPDPLFTARLYQETRGNPFFVTELLKSLFERGLLAWNADQQWDVSKLGQANGEFEWPLPRGLHQAVQQRLEQLAGGSRRLLELTAVLGGKVKPALLHHASGWKKQHFRETVDDLLRRQLLVEADDHLHLVHDTFQQVLYRGIPAVQRRAMHEQVGETLERLAPERVEELAHHFVLAQQAHRAMPYCLQAGQRSWQLYAFRPALAYYDWTIEAVRQVGGTEGHRHGLDAHEERGMLLFYLGESEQALADFAAMRAHAAALDNRPAAARAVRRAAWLRGELLGEWEAALHGTRQAYELAVQSGSKREMAIALLDVGSCLSVCGEPALALEALQESLALADETDDSGARAASLQYMTLPYDLLGNYAAGVATAQEALAIWHDRRNRRQAITATLIDEACLHLHWGDFDQAARALQQADEQIAVIGVEKSFSLRRTTQAALRICQGQLTVGLQVLQQAAAIADSPDRNLYRQAALHTERGRLGWARGQPDAALQDFQEALELARRSGARPLVVEILNDLGRFQCLLGLSPQSQAHHQQALNMAAQTGFARGQAIGLAGLGLAQVALGQTSAGLSHLHQAVRQAHPLGPRSQGETLTALAAGCLEGWSLAPARALARRAGELATQMGYHPLLLESLLLEGQALAGLGHLAEAEEALRRALALTAETGYPLLRWEVLLHLGHLLAETGRPDEAQCFYEQAQRTVKAILSELEDEVLRSAFVEQPGVWALLGGTTTPRTGQVLVTLARLGTPSGRPLRPDDEVTVRWTVDAGDADAAGREEGGKKLLRQQRILRLLSEARAQGGDPSEGDLAQALGVSARTVRSDIAALRAAGRQVRTRGTRRGAGGEEPGPAEQETTSAQPLGGVKRET